MSQREELFRKEAENRANWTRAERAEASLWAIAHKLGIEKEELPGQLAAQIVEKIDELQRGH